VEPTVRPGLAGQVAVKRGRDAATRLPNNPETGSPSDEVLIHSPEGNGVVQYHFGDRDGLLMAVVDKGFGELLESLHELPLSTENTCSRTESIVTAAWEAFSSPTSMAALEILIATRAMRDTVASEHLGELGGAFAKLGRHIGKGLDARCAAAIGNMIWATLRGLVVAQLVVPEALDTRRERRALVDMITAYVDGMTA
jgi:AcrR family transcriptional regulator